MFEVCEFYESNERRIELCIRESKSEVESRNPGGYGYFGTYLTPFGTRYRNPGFSCCYSTLNMPVAVHNNCFETKINNSIFFVCPTPKNNLCWLQSCTDGWIDTHGWMDTSTSDIRDIGYPGYQISEISDFRNLRFSIFQFFNGLKLHTPAVRGNCRTREILCFHSCFPQVGCTSRVR